MVMFVLFDTFNNQVVSRHRSIEAAEKADVRFQRAIKKANGKSSYIPTQIREETKDGLQAIREDQQEYAFHLYANQ